MDKLLYIDVETNGIGSFRPANQRIVQLAWVIGNHEKSYFINKIDEVNPAVPHPYDVSFCEENGVDFDIVINEFYNDMKDATKIVAHNADFDIGCITNELIIRSNKEPKKIYDKVYKLLKKIDVFDTMKSTVNICKILNKWNKFKWPKLEELYRFLFKKNPDIILHDALNDCIVTKDCLEELINTGHFNGMIPIAE